MSHVVQLLQVLLPVVKARPLAVDLLLRGDNTGQQDVFWGTLILKRACLTAVVLVAVVVTVQVSVAAFGCQDAAT